MCKGHIKARNNPEEAGAPFWGEDTTADSWYGLWRGGGHPDDLQKAIDNNDEVELRRLIADRVYQPTDISQLFYYAGQQKKGWAQQVLAETKYECEDMQRTLKQILLSKIPPQLGEGSKSEFLDDLDNALPANQEPLRIEDASYDR